MKKEKQTFKLYNVSVYNTKTEKYKIIVVSGRSAGELRESMEKTKKFSDRIVSVYPAPISLFG